MVNQLQVPGKTARFMSQDSLTLPEFFMQWRNQKDSEDSHKHSIIRFTGEQCDWPTFSGKSCKGGLKSNPTSASPCRFLPEALDLETIFKVCLAGTLEWKTTSLCEETKQQAAKGPEEASEEAPEEQHQEQHQEPPAKAAKKVTKNQLAASGDAGDAQEKQGDSDGEEFPSGSANEDQENSDNSSHSEAEQANAPHEPGEVAQTIPRKPKRKRPEHENTEQDTNPNPLVKRPHSGSDVTGLVQSLMNSIANHTFVAGDPIIQHFDDIDNMLNTGNILMVFTRKKLGLSEGMRKDSV
jgi:hypothetical protein